MCDFALALSPLSIGITGWQCAGTANIPTTSICTWNGVSCTDGVVTGISIYGFESHGSVPSSLGSLSRLTSLDLWFNDLSGSIPSSLCNLPLNQFWLNYPYQYGDNSRVRCYSSCLSTVSSLYTDYNLFCDSAAGNENDRIFILCINGYSIM